MNLLHWTIKEFSRTFWYVENSSPSFCVTLCICILTSVSLSPMRYSHCTHSCWLWSDVIDTVFVGISLALARMLGLKQIVNEPHVGITVSYSNLPDMTAGLSYRSPWSQSAAAREVGNTALTCMTIRTPVGRWLHMLPSHQTLGIPHGFNWGTLTNQPTNQQTN